MKERRPRNDGTMRGKRNTVHPNPYKSIQLLWKMISLEALKNLPEEIFPDEKEGETENDGSRGREERHARERGGSVK